MKRARPHDLLRQGVWQPALPSERRTVGTLAEDLRDSPVTGRPLRLRNFRPSTEGYLTSLGGPLPFMVRLREIARLTDEHEAALAAAWQELAETSSDEAVFAQRWRERAGRWPFAEVNDLIESHNRWYPVESRLPMDPLRRDYALINGKDYRLEPLDGDWVLKRFPARSRSVA